MSLSTLSHLLCCRLFGPSGSCWCKLVCPCRFVCRTAARATYKCNVTPEYMYTHTYTHTHIYKGHMARSNGDVSWQRDVKMPLQAVLPTVFRIRTRSWLLITRSRSTSAGSHCAVWGIWVRSEDERPWSELSFHCRFCRANRTRHWLRWFPLLTAGLCKLACVCLHLETESLTRTFSYLYVSPPKSPSSISTHTVFSSPKLCLFFSTSWGPDS